MKINKKDSGITLVALIVTIIVLIILSTVSIRAVLGENGIIKKAQQVKKLEDSGIIEEEEELNRLAQHMEELAPLDETTLTTGPNGKPLVTEVTKTNHETIIGEDEIGNQVVIPGGFKISSDSGGTVQQGIVVEDESKNQFVWIPVSNINHDGSNKIKLDDDSEVEITLGRYSFDTSTGTETKVQYGSEYAETSLETVQAGSVETYKIEDYYYELTDIREADSSSGTNSTAKYLEKFINSVRDNKGYYIARYEASFASGSTFGVGNSSSYYKPASKVSTDYSKDSMNKATGTLWNFITQGDASKASRQMYYGDLYVESDLCNSYAWDTTIVYIQAMGNSNYANANCSTVGNSAVLNTGATGDEKCKIFDMSANLKEWTTEYSTSNVLDSEGNAVNACCTMRGSKSILLGQR